MNKYLIKLYSCLLVIMLIGTFGMVKPKKGFTLSRSAKKTTSVVPKKTKSYTQKTPYAGFGKKSSVNGQIKIKSVSGHCKNTGKGYKHVNSYSRSK